MDTSELYARGLRRRKAMFGEADVEKRMAAAGEFGAPLQNIINAYVYGDVWERSGLPDNIRSLVMLGITAASNKPAEFRVHAKGALANGCMARSRCRMCCCWLRCIAACRPRSKPTASPPRFLVKRRQPRPIRRPRRKRMLQ